MLLLLKKLDSLNQQNCLEREAMKQIQYASAVGSLIYTQVCTCLDIVYAVSVLCSS